MIYFDNAATTRNKPQEVYDAAKTYLTEIGVSPGRGSYSLGIMASRELYQSRCAVGEFFGLSKMDRVVFTKNSTEAINLLFNGILHLGDHVIISCYEHNAVLRPLENLKRQGIIEYDVIQKADLELPDEVLYEKYARKNTRLLALTLSSNLTGRILYRPSLFATFRKKGVLTFVDASQGAGKLDISIKDDSVDYLAFTGHKDLLALPGVGGLCCESEQHLVPLIQGGTGIHGHEYTNPDVFPDGLEAGTMNMPAISSLRASLDYIKRYRSDIRKKEEMLMDYLLEQISKLENITIYEPKVKRTPTCCFTCDILATDRVVYLLDQSGICVRGGIHCAILAHEAIGTVKSGAVRLSLNYNNTIKDIDDFVTRMKEILKC